MPVIDVILNGAFDTRDFFAPATTPVTAIAGTEAMVQVTLQGGLTLVYTGSGLQFSNATPTAGTVTGVQVLRSDGSTLARMDLSLAPWNLAEITTDAPFQSYLANPHRQIYDFAAVQSFAGNTYFVGGDQTDELNTFFGADTLLGGAGNDIVRLQANAYPQQVAPVGLTLDGGTGTDRLEVFSSIGADVRLATIRNFETISIGNGALLLSGTQLGAGGIALTTNIEMFSTNSPQLIVAQVAGRAVDLSQFGIGAQFVQGTRMQINGTADNDVQRGNARSADILLGGDGMDRLYGEGGTDRLFGGTGDDILIAGDDLAAPAFPGANSDELRGGDGNDRLLGGVGSMSMFGEAGDDVVDGRAGFATIFGGDGSDWLKGGSATFAGFGGSVTSSRLDGGAGNDTLVTGADGTVMNGGSDDDRYVINHAGSQVQEGAGGGNDRVLTTVSLTLQAAAEVERIIARSESGLAMTGSDTGNAIIGNLGADTLNGAGGDDVLIGGGGADRLTGGLGQDRMTGGADGDVFVFATGFGRDVIADFTDGQDLIDLTALAAVTDFADLQANHLTQAAEHVVLNAGENDVLVIRNTLIANLDAADFVF